MPKKFSKCLCQHFIGKNEFMNIQSLVLIFMALQLMIVTYYLGSIHRTVRHSADKEKKFER